MGNVKLIAKENTWFKAGTEVYDEDYDFSEKKRLTLEKYEKWAKDRMICVVGIRVCELEYEFSLGYKKGEERIDGECCGIDEFYVIQNL